MSSKKIVIAYDGSPSSDKALQLAGDLFKAEPAELFLTVVIERPSDIFTLEKLEREREALALQTVENGKEKANALGLTVSVILLKGNPAEEILNYAHKENASLIVAGTRGLGGVQRLMLGSVAQNLITRSDIPILVAK